MLTEPSLQATIPIIEFAIDILKEEKTLVKTKAVKVRLNA